MYTTLFFNSQVNLFVTITELDEPDVVDDRDYPVGPEGGDTAGAMRSVRPEVIRVPLRC